MHTVYTMVMSEAKKKYNKEYCQRPEVKAKKAEYIRNKYKYDPKFKKNQVKAVKKYYEENSEEIIAKQKANNETRSEEIKEYFRIYYKKNKEKLNAKSKKYYKLNKVKQ